MATCPFSEVGSKAKTMSGFVPLVRGIAGPCMRQVIADDRSDVLSCQRSERRRFQDASAWTFGRPDVDSPALMERKLRNPILRGGGVLRLEVDLPLPLLRPELAHPAVVLTRRALGHEVDRPVGVREEQLPSHATRQREAQVSGLLGCFVLPGLASRLT